MDVSSTTGSEHTYLTEYWQQEQKQLEPIRLLYYFQQNYPLKQERIYESNQKVLKEKINAFKIFSNAAIAKAPKWSTKEREDHVEKHQRCIKTYY